MTNTRLWIGLVLLVVIAGLAMPVSAAGTAGCGYGDRGCGTGGVHIGLPHMSDRQPPHLGDPLPESPHSTGRLYS